VYHSFSIALKKTRKQAIYYNAVRRQLHSVRESLIYKSF